MAAAFTSNLLELVRYVYSILAGTVNDRRQTGKNSNMTPAAFTQTDMVRDSLTAPRLEQGALRQTRTPRRLPAFTADAPTLFHAWRP